ncbi:phosphohistidine phosphatase SixA [Klebsiella pneumoniae]|uniref:Phosphohistidine phosphatase SixA n=1 Tax=Klebsiella pneumoniae TaxID=573 RepID=A0A2X3F2L7_KLEPN|nr:phosphohistidine phosphatase SixA [Klebsiella pneumoniae]
MATWLKGQKVDIERVLVSPYLRAEQTLDIVGECMNLPKHVDVMPELTPCGDVGMVSAYLQALANEGVATALVVSHLPLVGVSGLRAVSGGNAPDVHHLGYRLP